MSNMMEGTWDLILWSHHANFAGLEHKNHMSKQCFYVLLKLLLS